MTSGDFFDGFLKAMSTRLTGNATLMKALPDGIYLGEAPPEVAPDGVYMVLYLTFNFWRTFEKYFENLEFRAEVWSGEKATSSLPVVTAGSLVVDMLDDIEPIEEIEGWTCIRFNRNSVRLQKVDGRWMFEVNYLADFERLR